MNPFEINVADLRRSRAQEREIDVAAKVDWSLEMSRIEPAARGADNLNANLTLSPIGGGLLVHGTASFVAHHTCHRCLTEWSEPVVAPVSAMFTARSAADDDETFPLGDVIDLEPALRDDVLLAMPISPTCPDGCDLQIGDQTSHLGDETSVRLGDETSVQLGHSEQNGLNTTAPAEPGSADGIPEDQIDEGSPFSVLRDLLEPDD